MSLWKRLFGGSSSSNDPSESSVGPIIQKVKDMLGHQYSGNDVQRHLALFAATELLKTFFRPGGGPTGLEDQRVMIRRFLDEGMSRLERDGLKRLVDIHARNSFWLLNKMAFEAANSFKSLARASGIAPPAFFAGMDSFIQSSQRELLKHVNPPEKDPKLQEFIRRSQNNPNSHEAYFELGLAYSQRGDLQKSIECFQHAIQLRPGFAQAYYDLGVDLYALGKEREAIQAYESVLKFDPGNQRARHNLELIRSSREASPP